jgi:primosomal protein N''
VTTGHRPPFIQDSPTHDEVDQIRQVVALWKKNPDELSTAAVAFNAERLLRRIDFLERLLARASR